ncbi:protein of unknown function (plasmid) [Azospirillum baldaniorum]|uniref:Uncharacterized protein n=1 Tax=Azospirillum baldaniorum TaxID=1064539 RepID=A0A9P1JXQ2_9PROT|nr:protein of unknown function [Azospirillum baldaniorum]
MRPASPRNPAQHRQHPVQNGHLRPCCRRARTGAVAASGEPRHAAQPLGGAVPIGPPRRGGALGPSGCGGGAKRRGGVVQSGDRPQGAGPAGRRGGRLSPRADNRTGKPDRNGRADPDEATVLRLVQLRRRCGYSGLHRRAGSAGPGLHDAVPPRFRPVAPGGGAGARADDPVEAGAAEDEARQDGRRHHRLPVERFPPASGRAAAGRGAGAARPVALPRARLQLRAGRRQRRAPSHPRRRRPLHRHRLPDRGGGRRDDAAGWRRHPDRPQGLHRSPAAAHPRRPAGTGPGPVPGLSRHHGRALGRLHRRRSRLLAAGTGKPLHRGGRPDAALLPAAGPGSWSSAGAAAVGLRSSGGWLRARLLQQRLQDHARDLGRLDGVAAQNPRRGAVACPDDRGGRAESAASRPIGRDYHGPHRLRVLGADLGRSPVPAPERRPDAGHPALRRPHDGERRAVGRASAGDVPRAHAAIARRRQSAPHRGPSRLRDGIPGALPKRGSSLGEQPGRSRRRSGQAARRARRRAAVRHEHPHAPFRSGVADDAGAPAPRQAADDLHRCRVKQRTKRKRTAPEESVLFSGPDGRAVAS